jgi:hypothetical protein
MLLKEIRLQTNKLSELYYYYSNVLTLPTIFLDKKSISITAGKYRLIFEESPGFGNPFYHFAFNIPSNKFEEAFELMKNKVDLMWLEDYNGYIANFVNWNARSFYFPDSAGNILEFISRFDLKDNVNENFTGSCIRNISEIGLVFPVDGFDEAVEELFQKFPLHYFGKQPPLEHFRAIGDDTGLFIIVPEKRIWFATKDIRSAIFPIAVNFNFNGRSCELFLP